MTTPSNDTASSDWLPFVTEHYKLLGLCAYFYLSAVGYAYDYIYYGHGYGLPIVDYVAFNDVAFSILKHWFLIIVLFLFVGLLPYLLYRYRHNTQEAWATLSDWLYRTVNAVDAAFTAVTNAVAPLGAPDRWFRNFESWCHGEAWRVGPFVYLLLSLVWIVHLLIYPSYVISRLLHKIITVLASTTRLVFRIPVVVLAKAILLLLAFPYLVRLILWLAVPFGGALLAAQYAHTHPSGPIGELCTKWPVACESPVQQVGTIGKYAVFMKPLSNDKTPSSTYSLWPTRNSNSRVIVIPTDNVGTFRGETFPKLALRSPPLAQVLEEVTRKASDATLVGVKEHTAAQHGTTRSQLRDYTTDAVAQGSKQIIDKIGDRRDDLHETDKLLKDEIAALVENQHGETRSRVQETNANTTAQHETTRAQLQDRTTDAVAQAAKQIIEEIGARTDYLHQTERLVNAELAALVENQHGETRNRVQETNANTTAQHETTRAQLQDRTTDAVAQAAKQIIEKIGDRTDHLHKTEKLLNAELAALVENQHGETRNRVQETNANTTAQHETTRAQLQDRTTDAVAQAAKQIIEEIGDRTDYLHKTEELLNAELAALVENQHQETRNRVQETNANTTAQHETTRAQLQDRTTDAVAQAAKQIIEEIGDRTDYLHETEKLRKDEIAALVEDEHQAARKHVTNTVETLSEHLRPVVSSSLVARYTIISRSGYETIYAVGGFAEAEYALTQDQIIWLQDFRNFLQACDKDDTPTRLRLVGFASAQQHYGQPPQNHDNICRTGLANDATELDLPNCYLANQRVAEVASLLNDPENYKKGEVDEMMDRLNASCGSGRNPEVALSAGLIVRPWCEVGQMKRARFNAPGEVQPDFLNRSVHLMIQKPGDCANLDEKIAQGR